MGIVMPIFFSPCHFIFRNKFISEIKQRKSIDYIYIYCVLSHVCYFFGTVKSYRIQNLASSAYFQIRKCSEFGPV